AEGDVYVLAFDVPSLAQALSECILDGRRFARRSHTQEPDHRHRRLLRVCRERPRGCRAADQRDELAAPHSITSSARASTAGGTSRPSAFAVFRLITSSYFVGACTGRSAGFSTLRMRSIFPPARRSAVAVLQSSLPAERISNRGGSDQAEARLLVHGHVGHRSQKRE